MYMRIPLNRNVWDIYVDSTNLDSLAVLCLHHKRAEVCVAAEYEYRSTQEGLANDGFKIELR